MTTQSLVVESETEVEREERRASVGRSAGESFAATLKQLVVGCAVRLVAPTDDDGTPMTTDAIAGFDAVFLGGSPLHVYERTPAVG